MFNAGAFAQLLFIGGYGVFAHEKSAVEGAMALFKNPATGAVLINQFAEIELVAHGSTPYAGEQPVLPAATVPGAMNEPAKTTNAAHAKKSAIDLPIL